MYATTSRELSLIQGRFHYFGPWCVCLYKYQLSDKTFPYSVIYKLHILGNTPKQVLRAVAGNDGDGDAADSTARERGRVNGEREWVGAVTQTPVTFVARTERPTLAVLARIGPVTHHRWEGGGREEEDTIFLFQNNLLGALKPKHKHTDIIPLLCPHITMAVCPPYYHTTVSGKMWQYHIRAKF